MAVLTNLHTNPALSVDNSPATWFGSGYARITGAHASLPRSTAWSGTGGAPVAGRFNGSPGKYYVVTGSVRFTGASNGYFQVDWKTSSNGYIQTVQLATFSQGAGTTARLGGVALAPANTDHGDVVVNELDGATQITAMMVREFALEADALAALAVDILPSNYFDGDTAGASWNGTTGKSSSTITRNETASGEALFAALQAVGTGVRETFGAGEATFAPLLAASGLIPSAQYDRRRGRIRVTVDGLAASVVRVVVYSRPIGTSRWSLVRGGKIPVTAGVLQRPVDDYEYQAGTGMQYRIDALDTLENQPDHVVQTTRVSTVETEDRVWLKFIPAPWTNLPVELVVDDWELSQDPRSEVHEVAGASPPIVVSDVHGSTRTTIRLRAADGASLATLRRALSQGAPAYLQIPDSVPLPTMYVSIGKHSARRWGGRGSGRWLVTVDVIEVAPPPPSVLPRAITWGIWAAQFASWGEAAASADRWSDVVS